MTGFEGSRLKDPASWRLTYSDGCAIQLCVKLYNSLLLLLLLLLLVSILDLCKGRWC